MLVSTVVGILGFVGLAWASLTSAQGEARFENLQVLPADIAREELFDIMTRNLLDLGLPRRASRGCLFCHVGSMDVPSSEWDWASDENPMKAKARVMMSMVHQINAGFLSALPERSAPDLEVDCYTCHAGRTNPMPLPDLLVGEFDAGGTERLIEVYRSVRGRYYEADAYDFRVRTLIEVADRIAEAGHDESAAEVHALNVEVTDDPVARGGLIRFRMRQAWEERGIEAMVERYHDLKLEHPSEAFRPLLLSPLATSLRRAGNESAALELFELNLAEHPDAFVATEDLAWAVELMGDHDRALELAERWVARNPDHESGRRLLADLRSR